MHYYQFNIGDYIKNTTHLSAMEDLTYRRLLDFYYDSELPIPTDIPLVSRRLRLDIETVTTVLSEFFQLTENGYKNHRADLEITAYHAYLDKQKANGIKGGRPKKTHGLAKPNPTGNPTVTQNNPKHKPETINHKTNIVNEEFDVFWKAYPRKDAKPVALKAFIAAGINGNLSDVLADIEKKKQSDSWKTNGGKYIPMPASYLNQRRWEDETTAEPSAYDKMMGRA